MAAKNTPRSGVRKRKNNRWIHQIRFENSIKSITTWLDNSPSNFTRVVLRFFYLR